MPKPKPKRKPRQYKYLVEAELTLIEQVEVKATCKSEARMKGLREINEAIPDAIRVTDITIERV